mgnify:CR=1 FL=1|jgi:hypothetical protein|tara:strand:- start:1441 stop:1794 length:354 start_codon:yes stop_codon:yes gene_type:complete
MTYTYDFYFGETDSSTFMENNKLVVEYVYSSVSECIKIVEMTRHGEDAFGNFGEQRHSISWFSKEGRERLFQELEDDMTNRMCGVPDDAILEPFMQNLMADEESDCLNSQAEIHYGI